MKLSMTLFSLFTLLTIFYRTNAQDLKEDASEICPVLVGETLPDGTVKNIDGEAISVNDILKEKPTVLIFYRGGWCPYCNKQLAQLNKIEKKIAGLGFQIIAISADNPEHLQNTFDKKELNYKLFSDAKMTYAEKLGIAFRVDDKTIKKYKTIGIDLEESSGESHFQLPVPAVFVADKKGLIHFSYINPNYKVRLDAQVLLAALKSMQVQS